MRMGKSGVGKSAGTSGTKHNSKQEVSIHFEDFLFSSLTLLMDFILVTLLFNNFRLQRKRMNVLIGCRMAGILKSEPEKVVRLWDLHIRWLIDYFVWYNCCCFWPLANFNKTNFFPVSMTVLFCLVPIL